MLNHIVIMKLNAISRWLALTAALVFAANGFAQHQMARALVPRNDGLKAKGTVHLVVNSNSDARQIFTSFGFPPNVFIDYWSPPLATGIYRLEVSVTGEVSAITPLKSMGSPNDIMVMKTFVHWRAKPGPFRLVDVHCMIPKMRGFYRRPL